MDNNNKNGNLNLNFQKGFKVTMKQNYVHPTIFNSQYLDNDIILKIIKNILIK
jgi:hypothetical protein